MLFNVPFHCFDYTNLSPLIPGWSLQPMHITPYELINALLKASIKSSYIYIFFSVSNNGNKTTNSTCREFSTKDNKLKQFSFVLIFFCFIHKINELKYSAERKKYVLKNIIKKETMSISWQCHPHHHYSSA